MKLKDAIPYKILLESVFDKTSLKAIFMAGGPGSGKSYIARGLFGIPEGSYSITSKHDMKVVNSDTEFEMYLRKFGFDTETGDGYGKGTLDLDMWPQEVWDMIGGEQSPEDAKENPNLRAKAKYLSQLRKDGYMNNRLGMIIDGTARDYGKIAGEKKELESLGYDTYMVFVNTTLEVAQKRNMERQRRLPPELLDKSWHQVQQNMGKFQGLFKSNFLLVDNSKFLSEKEATRKFNMLVNQGVGRFITRPIRNPIGKKWISNQKALVKNKKKWAGIK